MPMFNMVFPIITNLIQSGQLQELGLEAGDPPQLAMQVQGTALTERFQGMVDAFKKRHPEVTCALFDEVDALEELRTKLGEASFDQQMWDFSMFHPSPFGHERLAEQAQQFASGVFPGLSPPNLSQPATAPLLAAPGTTQGPQANAAGYSTGVESVRHQESQPKAAGYPAATQTAKAEEHHSKAVSSLPAVETAKIQEPQKKDASINLLVKTVKGDTFKVSIDACCQIDDLRAEVLASAPEHVTAKGGTCHLAYKGKFLQDVRSSVAQLGLVDGDFLMLVMK